MILQSEKLYLMESVWYFVLMPSVYSSNIGLDYLELE